MDSHLFHSINILTLVGLIAQNNHVFQLFQNQFLNSKSLRKLYKSYFTLVIISMVLIIAVNILQTVDYIKLSFTFPILSLSSIYLVRSQLTRIDPFDQLERQLLITPSTTNTPQVMESSTPLTLQLQVHPPSMKLKSNLNNNISQLNSTDISPIISPILNSNNNSLKLSKSLNNNKLNGPILATLLGAETVNAQSSLTTTITAASTSTHQSTTILILTLIISITFITSQWCYTFALLKSNVYTPLRHNISTMLINLALSVCFILLIQFDQSQIPILQFGTQAWISNYIISLMLMAQSVFTMAKLWRNSYSEKESLQVIEVYNSISSPVL